MRQSSRSSILLLVGCLLAVMAVWITSCKKSSSGPTEPGPSNSSTSVRGIVTRSDTAGTPALVGASVRIGTGTPVITGAAGDFSINVTPGTNVTLSVSKSGYSLNEVVVNVAGGTTKAISVGLLKEGPAKTFAVSSKDSIADGSYKLTVPPNFVTGSGNVTVSVTGLDPTTSEIKALPGGLEAIDAGGNTKYLKPVSFAEYVARDASGNVLQVNQSAGQGANIELPIPASLRGQTGYNNGDPIECYLYDAASGKWKTPVPGIVGPSSIDGQPAIKATIFHLSWYGGAPAFNARACIHGYVRNANGSPAAGVDVEGFAGGSATTGADGSYQIDAAPNSNVRVVATAVQGTTIRSGEVLVFTGGTQDSCASSPDITLGAAQAGTFEVDAILYKVLSSGSAFDFAAVDISLKTPAGGSSAWNTAVVKIGYGSQSTTVPSTGSGGYTLFSPNIVLASGQNYFITIDFDNNGTIDANGQVRMTGSSVITNPAPSASVGKTFTAAWTDSGSTVPGYSADYFVTIVGDSAQRIFLTKQTSKVVGDGTVDSSIYGYPQYNNPVPAGNYSMSLWGFNGPAGFLTIGNQLPNINGQNVTGYFYAYSFAEGVSFTSTGLSVSRIPIIAMHKQQSMPAALKKLYAAIPKEVKKRLRKANVRF